MNIEEAQAKLKEGVVLAEKDGYEDAITIFTQILTETPNISSESAAQVYVQRGRCHWEMRRWEEAAADFEKAHELQPENPDCGWTLCLVYLQMNQFDRAWQYLEWRWKSKKFDSPRLKTPTPQWDKNSQHDHVFVWSEQGLGDQILYLSLLHHVKSRANKVTVMIDARLFPILRRSFPDVTFVPQNERLKGINANIPLASICAQFIHSLSDIDTHAARKYLKADEARAQELKATLGQGERLIGISWHSGAPRIGNHKSVPIAELLPLFKLPNTRFVSLQYGDCYEDLYELEKQHGIRVQIVPAIDNQNDIDGLCALIAACDQVVTVSNATGHFAGALGVPTYVLNSNKLWYWSNVIDGHNAWYPSVKLYPRANMVTPWTEQIQNLVEDLR